MPSDSHFIHTAWSLLQDKLKSIFVSKAKLKQEADTYAAQSKAAWRIAKAIAEEARLAEAAGHGGAAYAGEGLPAIATDLSALQAQACPEELKHITEQLKALLTWLQNSATQAQAALQEQATARRIDAEQMEAQLVVNARHAATAADRFVGY
jgi:hypothetical protein